MALLGNRKSRGCNVEESRRNEKKEANDLKTNGEAAKRRNGKSLGEPRTPGGVEGSRGLVGEGEKGGRAL